MALVLMTLISYPVRAQTGSRFDEPATRRAVAQAAKAAPMSRGDRVIVGAAIGGAIGAMSGWWLYQYLIDCGTCGPGATNAVVSTAVLGAGIGALIGSAGGHSPQRATGIPIGRRLTAVPAVSPARVGGAVTIAF
jgi:hypothetical protein